MPYADPEKRKEYNREYQRKWARENRDKRLAYETSWNERNRERRNEISRERYYRDPRKTKAGNLVRKAIQRGKLVRLACQECGNPKSQAHHEDYDKPLEVIFLCRKHHMERHRTHT